MKNCLVTKLANQVNNSNLRKIGESVFLIPAGRCINLQPTATIICKAINGTVFKDGTTTVSGINNVLLVAPTDADVIVSVNNKYVIGGITGTKDVYIGYKCLDERLFDYYSVNTERLATIVSHNARINANHKPFGYCPGIRQIGDVSSIVGLTNFDWYYDYNGLTSQNLPNMTAFGPEPDVDVDIKCLGRLVAITNFYFRPSVRWTGEINDLCNAFLANGKTNDFTIITNSNLKLNGVKVGYGKTVTCTYDNGTYVCTVS